MGSYPEVDPIPLPAPVWLFKVLHLFTMSLHFTAVHLLLGGLLVGTVWMLAARRGKGGGVRTEAAGAVARPLPIVMTYVINLGVPPLLFTQVLYGRALYTTSVLIGAYWISIVGLVMTTYFLLYYAERKATRSAPRLWPTLVALVCAASVAFIYVNTMTLMLRPEVWPAMYAANPSGVHLSSGDPTILPRWGFMLTSALATTGIGLAFLAQTRTGALAVYLRQVGGRTSLAATLAAALAGAWVLTSQPAVVRDGILGSAIDRWAGVLWAAGLAVVAAAGLAIAAKPTAKGWGLPTLGAVGAYLAIASWVVVRDGIRDVTLRGKAYEVWDRAVVTNWGVVILFLVILLVGLAAIAWMVHALVRGKGSEASHA
jgi:hypothetical protein